MVVRSAILLSLLAAIPLVSQELTNPLLPAQVACDQDQLGSPLERMDLLIAEGPVVGKASHPTLFVSAGDGGLRYRGSEVRAEPIPHFPALSGGPVPDSDCLDSTERMMGFQVSVQERQFLLNPSRPELDQILLARIEPQTNPTSIRCRLPDDHRLRLGLGGAEDPFSFALEINNVVQVPAGRESQGSKPAASGASRGLRAAGLLDRCHDLLTDWDRRTFALLERMLRTHSYFVRDGSANYFDQEVAIFRGADPHTYRVDAYSIGRNPGTGRGEAVGKSAYELTIDWDASGRWTTGTIRALEPCQPGQSHDCSTQADPAWIFVYPPLLPDFGLRGDPANTVVVGRGVERAPTSAPVDWAALLAETAWNGQP